MEKSKHDRSAADAVTARRTIAIVGGGFSGTALCIHLLRLAKSPLHIQIIEPRAELGAGVAYAARDYPYPLNVAVGQMSLDPEQPHDFLSFAVSIGITTQADEYLPRQVYGEYLRARLSTARREAPLVTFEHCRARATELHRDHYNRWQLRLENGRVLTPETVVLATGNAPPSALPALATLAGTGRYMNNPWNLGAPGSAELESVLLVGSSLTMIDAALRLAAIRPRVRRIHVLSRHGFLPLSQSRQRVAEVPRDVASALAGCAPSTRALVATFRSEVGAIEAAGGDWRDALARARPMLPSLWQGLDPKERGRFLRHVRSVWDVHRHRVPSTHLAAVLGLNHLGILDIRAGRIQKARVVGGRAEISYLPRGAQQMETLRVDCVVNCTGPTENVATNPDAFVHSLVAGGLLRPNANRLGIDVTLDGRVVGSDGKSVAALWYIGPWLRARDWESTAVPELRRHARSLAQGLLQTDSNPGDSAA